jgi:hypothetical protein
MDKEDHMQRWSAGFAVALTFPALAQDSRTFNFAQVGQSYSAAIFAGDPDVGRRIIRAEIVLRVRVDTNSNAAEFSTDILLPIDADSGNSVFALAGADQNWSGSGEFEFREETTRYNGSLVARRYGAETFGVEGQLLEGSGITVFFQPARCVADLDDGTGTGTPDGGVTIDDLLYYLAIYAEGLPAADIDDGSNTGTPDGGVTIDDLLYFLLRFNAGC